MPQPEHALLVLAQDGDLNAFDELVRLYQGRVTALLYRFTTERADLEDLVQETFVKIYRKLSTWQARQPFEHWLMRIAVNVGRDFYRRQRRSSAVFRPMTERDDPAAEPVDATAALDEVHWLLGYLGPDDRTLLTLFYLEQLSIEQIASNLDWSESKTKVRLHRCRNKLRQILSDNGYEEF